MLKVMIGLAAVAVFGLSECALAQDLPSTVEAKEVTAGGKLLACSLEFSVTFRDQVYKRGAVAAVTGSINLWDKETSLYSSFKLVGADFDGKAFAPFKVNTASLFDPSGNPEKAKTFMCEDERNYCAGMSADVFLNVANAIAQNGVIRMGFNRSPSGMDVPIVLEAKPEVALQLVDCARKLTDHPKTR